MKALTACTKAELAACKQEYEAEYQDFKAQNLKLDMSRGKPAPEQLDLRICSRLKTASTAATTV